jgi:hypothetical protein
MVSLVACALLWGGAYAEDSASTASTASTTSNIDTHPQGTTAIQTLGSTAENRSYQPIQGGGRENRISPGYFSVYESSIFDATTTELLAVQKRTGFIDSNFTAGSMPGTTRTPFLLQKEHDAAIKLLTTNIALRLKLSTDGVHLNLVF